MNQILVTKKLYITPELKKKKKATGQRQVLTMSTLRFLPIPIRRKGRSTKLRPAASWRVFNWR